MQICVRAHDLDVSGSYEIIKELKEAGADGAQLVCYKSYEEVKKEPSGITEMMASEIGRSFKEAELSIKLIGAYFNPVHSNNKKVEDGIKIFKDYLRLNKNLGCNIVGSETGSYNDEPWIYHPKNRTIEAVEKVSNIFRKLCDYALKYDTMVAIEGARGHVCYDVETLDKATKLIDKDNLRIILDLYNFLDDTNYKDYLEILQKALKKFAGKIICFHIKDCIFAEDGLKQCAVGQGDLDFDKIIKMIKEYDEDAVLILEGTKMESIKSSIEFLRKKWQKA